MRQLPTKWDKRFLRLARFWAQECSKDPSTKCGAVLVSPDRKDVVLGYNGFPSGMDDDPAIYADRSQKYPRVVHAEINAILNSKRDLSGYTLYTWPIPPCDRCATQIIQAGVKRVVSIAPNDEQIKRWGEAMERAWDFFCEASVDLSLYERVETEGYERLE